MLDALGNQLDHSISCLIFHMALINCPECQTKVSSRAATCPQCGCPIASQPASVAAEVSASPKLPADLEIHDTDFSWANPDNISGNVSSLSSVPGFPVNSRATVYRHKAGIRLFDDKSQHQSIHYSQIASVEYIEAAKVIEEKKSVIGRALLGGIILGPVGAIVGGISGTGSNQKAANGFSITFWSINQRKYMSLVLETDSYIARGFVDSIKKHIKQYEELHVQLAI